MSGDPAADVVLDGSGPLYDQIGRAIRALIESGAWPPGAPVPPEHTLMERLGASRMTVHRALAQLARDGLIARRRRSGSVVASPPDSHALLDILSIPNEVARLKQAYRFEIIARRSGRQPAPVRERFDLPARAVVEHLELLHYADDRPHVLEERVIDLATVPMAASEAFSTLPPGDWLLAHTLWSQAEHAISAVAAGRREAELLAIKRGEPCLRVGRRTWQQNRPVTSVHLLYPGGRHRFVGRFGPYGAVAR